MSTRSRNAQEDRIDSEASAWLIRTEDSSLSYEDQRAFEAWRNADSCHAATYDDMAQTWAQIPELTGLASLVPPPVHATVGGPARAWHRRGIVLSGAAAAAVLLIAMLVLPTGLFQRGEKYRTQVAEMRIVTLPDGSSITLGARSSIAVEFTDRERRVVLSGGQALFDVVHADRPFLVEAGNAVVRDIGTKFDVNLSTSTVRVSVLEGKVGVSRWGRSSAPERFLVAGQRTEVALIPSAHPVTKQNPVDMVPVPALAPGEWREGRLTYDNVRLADLLSDVNRYYGPGVEIASSQIGDLRVTASFKISEIPAFMAALGTTLPVHADAQNSGAYKVSDAQ